MENFDEYGVEKYDKDKNYLAPKIESEGGTELLDNEEGWIIGARAGLPLRFPTDKHMITIANTGGGKGTSVAIPNLLNHEGSVLSVEIGGSTYRQTVNYRKHVLKQDIHVIDPFGVTGAPSASLNFLDSLDPEKTGFKTEISKLSETLLKDLESKDNPYFKITAKNLIEAMIIHVKTSSEIEDEDRHLIQVLRLISDHPNEEWSDLMERWSNDTGKYRTLLNQVGKEFTGSENDTKYGVISTARAALSSFADPDIAKITDKTSFDIADLRNKKITLYVVMPETEYFSVHATWLRLLTERSFAACPNLGNKVRDFSHNDRVLFMLDEFTQLGKLDAVDVGMQTARQKGITIWALFQDLGRLKEIYGDNLASSFLGSGHVQAFDIGDQITSKYISERIGKRIVHIPSFRFDTSESESKTETEGTNHTTGVVLTDTAGTQTGEVETWSTSDSLAKSNQTSRGTNQSTANSESFETPSKNIIGLSRIRYRNNPNMIEQMRAPKRNFGRTNQGGTSEGVLEGTTDTTTNQQGGSKSTATLNSNSISEQNLTTKTNSTAKTKGTNRTKGISWTPQIVPGLDPSQVEHVLGSNNAQIIFLRARNKPMKLIDRRANFYEIPELKDRAEGYFLRERPVPVYELPKASIKFLPSHEQFQHLQTTNVLDLKVDSSFEHQGIKPLTTSADTEAIGLEAYTQSLRSFQEAVTNRRSPEEITRRQTHLYETFAQVAPLMDEEALDIAKSISDGLDKAYKKDQDFIDKIERVRENFQKLLQTEEKIRQFEIELSGKPEVLKNYKQLILQKMDEQEEFANAAEDYKTFLKLFQPIAAVWSGISLPARVIPNTSKIVSNYPSKEQRRKELKKGVPLPQPRDFTTPKLDLDFNAVRDNIVNTTKLRSTRSLQWLLKEKSIKLRRIAGNVSAAQLIEILHKRNTAPSDAEKTSIGQEVLGKMSDKDLLYYLEKRMKDILPHVKSYNHNAISEQNKLFDYLQNKQKDWAKAVGKIEKAQEQLNDYSSSLNNRKSELWEYIQYLIREAQNTQNMDLAVHADNVRVHNDLASQEEWNKLENIKLLNENQQNSLE